MKKTVLTLLLAVAATASMFGQGSVTFQNTVSTFSTVADRFVYFDATGNPLNLVKGTQYRAQLYASTTAAGAFTAVDATPAAFRVTTTANPGTWVGVSKTIPAPIGAFNTDVFLRVCVWDSNFGTSFETVSGGYKGQSDIFAYHIPPTGQNPPEAFAMENLRAFAIVVPEPGTFALGGLGLLGLCLWRRRK